MLFNSNKKLSSGFTLIELLVVVAIIGILASIVLASLSGARAKGIDAVIKGGLSGARSQAEILNTSNQAYDNVCTTSDPNIAAILLSAVQKLSPTATVGGNAVDFAYDNTGVAAGSAVCHDSTTAWAAVVSLKVPTIPSAGWCVDSTGAAKEVTSLVAGVTAC